MTGGERVSPLPDEDDSRFTFGLVDDVATVLERHGYRRPTGYDWIGLDEALHTYLYALEQW